MSLININFFDQSSAKDSGGKTGSKQVKKNTTNYQLKPSIVDAKFVRKVKASGDDHENFGEFIASKISQALNPDLVPEVSLVHDAKRERIQIASKYIENVSGTLNDYAAKNGVTIKGKDLKISTTSREGAFNISGDDKKQLRKDLAEAIALSMLSGDHDINPGNMIVFKKDGEDRIARIDFGHAFNDLLRGGEMVGGALRNKTNQSLDFLNRETVSHLVASKRKAKLWRNYENLIPSQELADALRRVAVKDITKGLESPKKDFADLIKELQKDPKKNKKALQNIRNSLISINNNIVTDKKDRIKPLGILVRIKDFLFRKKDLTEDILNKTFFNIGNFYKKGQEQMLNTAKLVDMQVKIDSLLKGENVTPELVQSIKKSYEELKACEGIGKKSGIEWVKNSDDKKAFKGNLEEFLQERGRQLGVNLDKVQGCLQELKKEVVQEKNKERKRALDQISPNVLNQASKMVNEIAHTVTKEPHNTDENRKKSNIER